MCRMLRSTSCVQQRFSAQFNHTIHDLDHNACELESWWVCSAQGADNGHHLAFATDADRGTNLTSSADLALCFRSLAILTSSFIAVSIAS